MKDNDDRKSFLDYLCIDLNYVEEQRNNLMSKHRNLVQKLNTCKEQLLVLKQAKLDLLTMQHVNTKFLKENQNLRNELKELTTITEAWLNSSNKVKQCISEQIPTQKKKILVIDQLTEDTSSFGPKDPVFVKSSTDNSEVSITSSNKPKLSEAKDSTLSNHDTGKHPLPPLGKLTGVEPISETKTIKSILKSKFTFKTKTLKGIKINEPSSAPARGNKSSSTSKTNSAPVEVMEFESAQSNTTAKLPILKLVTKMSILVTAEEKTNKKNDVKARSLLLMDLPNEHQLTFIWMNKAEIETMSIDDLYNNFKVVEQNVKKYVSASSGAQNLDFVTAPSTSNTNDVNTAKPEYEVSTASPNVNTASPQQIHEDDLEAIDLKWQLSLLSMRAKRYYQRTGKKIFINANDTAGYDKSKVECFNCHKMGPFSRECRAPRIKEGQFRNQDNTRKQGNNEDTSSKAMLAIDGVAATYKRGLASVEEQFITYRKNEVLFSEEVAVLKREVACKDYEINVLKSEFKKVKQEKEGIEFKIKKFNKALKDLNQLLKSQITDKSKKGLGYNAVPPPHPLIYNRPKKLDLSYSGLDKFKEPEFKAYGFEVISKDTSSFVESSLNVDKETVFPVDKKVEFVKPKNHENPVKKSVRHMTGNIAYLSDFNEFDGGYVTFGGEAHGGRIYGKGTLKTNSLDFKDVYFVNELKFNLFSVSQMCDKKNYVLFTNTECLVLSPNFKLPDESQIFLKIPKKDNMYSFDMKNIVLKESLTCLVAKATSDESMLWHRRLGHINFKNINKLVKDNLVRGLPIKCFENDQTYVAYLKGKQHRASFTDDYSRFTWVFFLASKDETSEILKNFIKEIENLVDKKVKILRSDNGTYFKNKVMDDFCKEKGIRREYSVARTPQQNGVAEKRNRTLIEAARTMLANSKLPTTFWAEAVSTACYVQNRVLVVKPYNKTPYELFRGFKPALSFMRPFGCHVTILNTLDSLGKFDGKSDECFFVGYCLSIAAGTIINESPGTQGELNADVGNSEPKSAANDQKQVEDSPDNENDEKDKSEDDSNPKEVNTAGQHVNTASPEVNTGRFKLNTVDQSVNTASSNDQDSPKDMFTMGASHTFEATNVEFFSDKDEPEVDLGNILTSYIVPTTLNTRIHKDYPIKNVIGDMKSSVQTRRMTKPTSGQGFLSVVYRQKSHDTLNTCLYACFLSQIEPTSIAKALSYSSWRAIGTKWIFENKKDERGIIIRNKARLVTQGHRQEEGIDYEEVFTPVARIEAIRLFLAYASFMGFLVYQMDVMIAFLYGTIKEEGYVTRPPGFKDPDHPNKVYKVVKALYGLHQVPRAWYETLANYLLGNGFKRGKIDQTLFIKKQKGDILLVQVYVDDIIFGSTNKELCTAFEKLMKDKFQMSSMGELTFFLGLQVQQKEDGIFISQDKYVAEILKKFNYTDVKSASTLVDLEKPLVKDGDADDVDVHLYRSMIGSLMYLTTSRPDIMFAVCACARFQVTPKTSHLLAVKRIFRYLKGKPTLGLWYSRDYPFELVAYTDSDYARATQDRKSTTGGSKYVAAASCCGQQTAALCIIDDGVLGITTTIDRKVTIRVLEASIRRHLKLEDSEGIPSLPTAEIFEQLALRGYVTTFNSLTFQKGHFSLQWKFFIDTILHYLSPKKTAWEQFSSNIATAIICLATNRTFNFSKFIFDAMGEEPSIQTTPKISPSKITSLPSLSSHHTSISALSTLQPPITPTEEAAPMPHESPLHSVHLLGRDEGTDKEDYSTALARLILRVKKLEKNVKTCKARRRARIVISEDEDVVEDSSKQGRKISDIDTYPTISLVQPQQDMEYDFNVSTAEGLTTASIPVTTTSASISTVSPPRVSTAEDISGAETLVYISQEEHVNVSEESRKEKGSEKKSGGRRKKLLARKRAIKTLNEESAKKQKLEDDAEKEELQVYLNIVPEEESLDVESLATKYPIVDWETQIIANDKYYYRIKREDGSVKHYKIFSAMLYDFDRQDVLELQIGQG
ncbi:retrovirus-related pol polyprotein from transposon TNT 1-94 [Tanacetum coccineum]